MKSRGRVDIGRPCFTTTLLAITAISSTFILLFDLHDRYLASVTAGASISCWRPDVDKAAALEQSGNVKGDLKASGYVAGAAEVGNKSDLRTVGSAAYSFIVTGSHRRGPADWVITGLSAAALHVYGDVRASYRCEWVDAKHNFSEGSAPAATTLSVYPAFVDLPNIKYFLRTYVATVVKCVFKKPVGVKGHGGALVLHVFGPSAGNAACGWAGENEDDRWMGEEIRGAAGMHDQPGAAKEAALQVVAKTEKAGEYNGSLFSGPFKYDHVYCGSPLYGNLNGDMIAEWLSYHYFLFGNSSHFLFYDAGGVHAGVRKALEPWIKLGIVTVTDWKQVQQFEGFYYHQFLVQNQCLQRARFMANWVWFFDVDEYMVFRPPHTLQSILAEYINASEIAFEQRRFSERWCRESEEGLLLDGTAQSDKWTVETLLFATNPPKKLWKKYVVNPRNIFSVDVHWAREPNHPKVVLNETTVACYYHYHATITTPKNQLCRNITASNALVAVEGPKLRYELDDKILLFAREAKNFILLFFQERNV